MILTVAALIGGMIYSFGLGDFFDQFTSQTDQLDVAEKEYVEAIETLQEAPEIEKRYHEIESQVPTSAGGKRIDMAFTEEVVSLCRTLGITVPRLEPAQYEEIEGVEDYEFITVELRTEGNLDTMVKLLKAFQERGLLFREVDLRNTQDSDLINARVILARMAPVPEDVIKARQRERRSRRPVRGEGSDF